MHEEHRPGTSGVPSGIDQHIPYGPPPPPRSDTCRPCSHSVPNSQSTPRNLVICFDGTSNQVGLKNTNVSQLFERLTKTDNQKVYYNSGVGTNASPTIWQTICNVADMISGAGTFIERVLKGYEWLSSKYRPGDRIFCFGFSRGAYQAMTLAAMVAKIGLVEEDNKEQIPFAFQHYLNAYSGKPEDLKKAEHFKATLMREARIHFLGLWDPVSSLSSGKMPGADDLSLLACYIRIMYALDECRGMFQPEMARGGRAAVQLICGTRVLGDPQCVEVWAPGTHSDIGGGRIVTEESKDAPSIPLLWMINQAVMAGLDVTPSNVEWNEAMLQQRPPPPSPTWLYRITEIVPFSHWVYDGTEKARFKWHWSPRRVIQPGQMILPSVCFMGKDQVYRPKARFYDKRPWDALVRAGDINSTGWMDGFNGLIEPYIFDLTQIPAIIQNSLMDPKSDWVSRLVFIASTREGSRTVLNDANTCSTIEKVVGVNVERACNLISGLGKYDAEKLLIHVPKTVEVLGQLLTRGDIKMSSFTQLLWDLTNQYGELPIPHFSNSKPAFAHDDARWRFTIGSPWFQQVILAMLYFTRFLSSGTRFDIDKAETLLRSVLGLEFLSPFEQADLHNSFASILESRATISGVKGAVVIRSRLAEVHPNEYYFDYASTRYNLGTLILCERGPQTPTFTMTRSRRIMAARDDVKLDLARRSTKLATKLYLKDLFNDALETSKVSVGLFHQVYNDSLGTIDPDLATALNNLSNRLYDAGEWEEALKTAEGAVRMRRVLSDRDPTKYLSGFAISLANLSCTRCSLGDREGSLEAGLNAVRVSRGLSTSIPEEFYLQVLSFSLSAYSYAQGELGELEGALESMKECVELDEALTKRWPTKYTSGLANSLNNISIHYSRLGQRGDALIAIKRAVELRENLAKERPAAFTPVLAASLHNLSNRYSELGQREDALVAIKRAVELQEVLAKQQPAAFTPDLADSLINLSNHYSNFDQREDAILVTQRAIDIYEDLAQRYPAKFTPKLAIARYNLSVFYWRLNRHNDALKPAQDSLSMYRELVKTYPVVFTKDVVQGLKRLAYCLSGLGREDEAAKAREEANELDGKGKGI